jgi:hypothetical protein
VEVGRQRSFCGKGCLAGEAAAVAFVARTREAAKRRTRCVSSRAASRRECGTAVGGEGRVPVRGSRRAGRGAVPRARGAAPEAAGVLEELVASVAISSSGRCSRICTARRRPSRSCSGPRSASWWRRRRWLTAPPLPARMTVCQGPHVPCAPRLSIAIQIAPTVCASSGALRLQRAGMRNGARGVHHRRDHNWSSVSRPCPGGTARFRTPARQPARRR